MLKIYSPNGVIEDNDEVEVTEDQTPPPEPFFGVFTSLSKAVIVPPRWIIQDLIPTGLIVIGAPPKALKSTFMLAVSTVIAGYKCNVLPKGMESADVTGRVMGISAEATAGELRHMAEEGLGITLPDDDSIMIADDPWLFQLDEDDGVAKLLYWLNEYKPKLCFIDPFAEFHSLEEKDSRAMIAILRPLHRWAKDNDAAIVIVHHLRKPNVEKEGPYTALDLRGSTAIFGKMDGVLIFTPYDDRPGLITIDAKFKRGRSWRRDIQFAAYGEKGGPQQAVEVLDDIARMALGIVKAGVSNHKLIAKQLKVSKRRVGQAIDACVRTGRLARVGKKLVVCKVKKAKAPMFDTKEH